MRNGWSSGSVFEANCGYVRAVRTGNLVFVAGTTGFDYTAMEIADDLEAQVAQAIRNVEEALKNVGAKLADVIRVNWFITDPKYFEPAGRVLQNSFPGQHLVMTTLVCGLVDHRMKFEIEVTAVVES